MEQVIIDFGKKTFEANKVNFLASFNGDRFIDEQEKDGTYRIIFEPKVEECGFEDGNLLVNLTDKSNKIDCYFTLKVAATPDMLIAMAAALTKEYNRAKAFFEARPK